MNYYRFKSTGDKQHDALMDQVLGSVDRKRPQVAMTELTCAFLAGNQWTKSSISEGVTAVENPANEIRLTENRMLPTFENWMYYMQQEKPVLVGHEGGREVKDARSARVASSLFEYWESMCGWREAREEMAMWVAAGGVAFVAPAWRADAGRRKAKGLRLAEKPKRRDGLLSFLDEVEEERTDGDLGFEVFNPIQTHTFPASATTWRQVRSVAVVDLAGRDTLEAAYPDLQIEWSEADAARPADFNLAAIENANNFVGPMMGSMTDAGKEERFLRIQCWERPTRKHPRGRYRVYVAGRSAVDDDLPFVDEAREVDPNDAHNLTMGIVPWFGMKFPGRLVPPAAFAELLPYQTRINDLITSQKRNRDTVGINRTIIQKGLLEKGQWTNEHGQLIEVPATEEFEPKFIQGMPLVGLSEELGQAYAAFDAASGQMDVLQGKNVPNVRGGFHFETIRQEAMKRIFATILHQERCHEATGLLCLAIARRRYSTRRVLEIYGMDYAGDAIGWKSIEIRTDVRVQVGSLIPRNKALYEQKLSELMAQGAFGENLEQYWEMTELGTMNRAVDHGRMVTLTARRENAAMLVGVPEMPQEWEDHDAHVGEHELFMGSSLDYKESTAAVQALFLAHHEEHLRLRSAQLAPFADSEPIPGLADLMGGGGGPPGGMGGFGMSPPQPGQLAA